MKESSDSSHRKLIRPSLSEVKSEVKEQKHQQKRQHHNQNHRQKRSAPPEQTNAESFYYVKQMQNRTPLVLVLNDGEELSGIVEWYDKSCLKINRPDGPNVLVYKDSIKYLFKQSERKTSSEEESGPNGAGPNGSAAAN